ncbi:MAG: DUF4397 domain-containing protein [Chitinophagaceae bacterium]
MRNTFFCIAVLISLVAVMVACSKNDSSQPGPTHMRWINVTPGMAFDVYSDEEQIASDIAFDSVTSYAYGLPSFYYLQILKTGTSDTIVSGRQQMQSGLYYSMFVIPDTTSDGEISDTDASVAIVTENTDLPSIDTFKYRFFNFAPFTSPISVVMTIDGRTGTSDTLRPFSRRIFNDQASYSTYSKYSQTIAANWKIHFYNSTDTTLIDSFHYLFSSRGVYTIYLKAIEGVTTKNKFKDTIIQRGY